MNTLLIELYAVVPIFEVVLFIRLSALTGENYSRMSNSSLLIFNPAKEILFEVQDAKGTMQ